MVNRNDLMKVCNLRVSVNDSFSDHRYILFNLIFDIPKTNLFRNPRRTNWSIFRGVVGKKLTHSVRSNNFSIEDMEAYVNSFERTMNMAFKIACQISHNKKPYPLWWGEKFKNLRELTTHTFNECCISRQWQPYNNCLKVYKKAIRTAKKEGRRNICESLNSVKDTARLGRIFAGGQSPPSFLKKPAGSWTSSSK